MQGVGTGRGRRRDDGVGFEQVERLSTFGARHDRPDPEPVACLRDPCRDLPAVRDEQRLDRTVRLDVRLKRANRVKRDTPTTPNTPSRELSARDPALHGPSGRSEPPSDLAWAQFVGHCGASVAFATTRGNPYGPRGPEPHPAVRVATITDRVGPLLRPVCVWRPLPTTTDPVESFVCVRRPLATTTGLIGSFVCVWRTYRPRSGWCGSPVVGNVHPMHRSAVEALDRLSARLRWPIRACGARGAFGGAAPGALGRCAGKVTSRTRPR